MDSTIALSRSSVTALLPDEDDFERMKSRQWASTEGSLPSEVLQASDEPTEQLPTSCIKRISSYKLIDYIPEGYDSSGVVWDYYGDPTTTSGQQEKLPMTLERRSASLTPPRGFGHYIMVEYEPDDVIWDCYGNKV